MNTSERDTLLIRLDERIGNINDLTEKQEKHLSVLNKSVSKNTMNIDRNHNRLLTMEKSGGILLSKRQMAGGGVGIASLVVLLLATIIGKWLGWL